MRVAVVAPEHPNSPSHGGIARYLRDYLPVLAEHVELFLLSVEAGTALPGVPQRVVSCGGHLPSPLLPPFRSRLIVKELRNIQPDVVEYANFLGLGCLDGGGAWAKVVRLSTPIVHGSLRGGIMPRLARPLHHYWEWRTVRKADYWISNTQENFNTCRQVYGVDDKTAAIIPHGIHFAESVPNAGARDVLFVGRFEQRKGIDVLLRAWQSLTAANSLHGSRLHLVGRDTPGRNGGYLGECLAATPGIQESVVVHGALSEETLRELRKECRICVVPSRYESFGMVVLEAFASGLAVIASRAGGLREVVRDGVDGLLVPPEDSHALAEALRHLLTSPVLVEALAQEGRKALHNCFPVRRMVEQSLVAYCAAIGLIGHFCR